MESERKRATSAREAANSCGVQSFKGRLGLKVGVGGWLAGGLGAWVARRVCGLGQWVGGWVGKCMCVCVHVFRDELGFRVSLGVCLFMLFVVEGWALAGVRGLGLRGRLRVWGS